MWLLDELWTYPTLITAGVLVLVFLATRSRDWYYRKVFRLVMWKTMLLGPKAPIFPPSSKPPSSESIAFTSIFAQFPKLKVVKPALERRAAFERIGALQSPNPAATIKKPFSVPLLPCDKNTSRTHVTVYPVHPAVSVHGKVNLYLHAGTYISGSIRSHGGFVTQIAELSHRLTYFVEYALGPEAPVPHCVLDVVSVYHWLLNDQKVDPKDIMIIGDSAGGSLAFLSTMELVKREYPNPAGIWAMSPWTDLSCTGSSWKTHLKTDVMLNPFDFQAGSVCLEHATGIANSTVEQLQDPSISPLFATDFSRLPPCLIQVGGSELLLSDSIEMHKKLVQARVKSTIQVYDHQQHIFQLFYDWIPEAKHAINAGIAWINQHDQSA
jgi:acetyl esterase/lipase